VPMPASALARFVFPTRLLRGGTDRGIERAATRAEHARSDAVLAGFKRVQWPAEQVVGAFA